MVRLWCCVSEHTTSGVSFPMLFSSSTSIDNLCHFSVFSEMTDSTKFGDEQVSGQPNISEELMTLLTAAMVHTSILDGLRELGIATCCRFASLTDDVTDLREALSTMFNVDKKHGPLHRLEASKLVEVWSQAKARTETQQKVEARRAPSGVLGQPHEDVPKTSTGAPSHPKTCQLSPYFWVPRGNGTRSCFLRMITCPSGLP